MALLSPELAGLRPSFLTWDALNQSELVLYQPIQYKSNTWSWDQQSLNCLGASQFIKANLSLVAYDGSVALCFMVGCYSGELGK